MAADFATSSLLGRGLASSYFLSQARGAGDAASVDSIGSHEHSAVAEYVTDVASPTSVDDLPTGSGVTHSFMDTLQHSAHFFSKLLDAVCHATAEGTPLQGLAPAHDEHLASDSSGENTFTTVTCYNFSHGFFVLSGDFWLRQHTSSHGITLPRRPSLHLATKSTAISTLLDTDGFFGSAEAVIADSEGTNSTSLVGAVEVGTGVSSL
jgi:hypothetical protein